MILDQGYWPDTGLTAPSDAALRRDVELAKHMGFNGVRKHQKIEDPRYLYWADRLGLLVWAEMPSAYRFTRLSVERVNKQWLEALARDASHPCIVAWVPFNESWGVPNLPHSEAERQYVQALYHLTKTIDPTRPVVGNDGWEHVATDIIGIHDYDADARRLGKRYFTHEVLPKLLARERPGGRAIIIDRALETDIPIVLSEFGGISCDERAETWGYSHARDTGDLERAYDELLTTVTSLEMLAGFCYTQFADTYQETNGLLYADRTPKFPFERIAEATTRAMPKATLSEPGGLSSRGSAAVIVHKRELTKPDGRALYLYARQSLDVTSAPVPDLGEFSPNPHVRWHPLRGEWIVYASNRQERTFLPPADYDPLSPSHDPQHPTELPDAPYDVAVFENRFPTLFGGAHDPPAAIVDTQAARGVCEVVVFTKDAKGSLGALPLWNVEMVVHVWADRTRQLGARRDVAYVFPFENRGVEVGVTLHHPHGQIYAYPFVPPIAARELEEQRAYFRRTGRGLLATHLHHEVEDKRRMIYLGRHAAAFVPVFARWAYETWVLPVRPAARLTDLDDDERRDFARALKTVLLKLDGVFNRSMPYVLAIHQAPTDGAAHEEAHVHVEVYPYLRMASRLKYMAGSEIGAGVFTADTLPERTAEELRRVEVQLE